MATTCTVDELALQLIENNAIEKVMEVLEAAEDFIPQRQKTIARMREIADNLDKHKLRGNVAQLLGGGIAVGAVIVGGILAPFSFGASLGVGLGVSAAGLATSSGTRGVLWLLANDTKEEVDNILKKDEEKYNNLITKWNELNKICEKVERRQQKWRWNDIVDCVIWLAESDKFFNITRCRVIRECSMFK